MGNRGIQIFAVTAAFVTMTAAYADEPRVQLQVEPAATESLEWHSGDLPTELPTGADKVTPVPEIGVLPLAAMGLGLLLAAQRLYRRPR